MAQPSAAVLSAIAEGGNGILQTKYFFFAALAITVYDHVLTLDIEVEHIWKRKFSAVTVLFFFTRYYFLVAQFVDLFCEQKSFSRPLCAFKFPVLSLMCSSLWPCRYIGAS